jgi:hypothetical protein
MLSKSTNKKFISSHLPEKKHCCISHTKLHVKMAGYTVFGSAGSLHCRVFFCRKWPSPMQIMFLGCGPNVQGTTVP